MKDKPKFRVGQRVFYTSPVGREYDRLITISRIESDILEKRWMYFAFFDGSNERESYALEFNLEAMPCPMR